MLVRRGHLETVAGDDGKVAFYRRAVWPPARKLFTSGPVGITYYLQTWFRYYLQQWIDSSMRELESKEGVYSLDFRVQAGEEGDGEKSPGGGDLAVPHWDGEFVDAAGSREPGSPAPSTAARNASKSAAAACASP